MEQLVIIVPSTADKKFSMVQAKKAIVEYVGTRLIDVAEGEMPGVILKQCLPKEDKKELQERIFPSNRGVLMFIAVENVDELDYINAVLCDEDELRALWIQSLQR